MYDFVMHIFNAVFYELQDNKERHAAVASEIRQEIKSYSDLNLNFDLLLLLVGIALP